MIIFFAAILGACVGSFLNVCALRWHEQADLWSRSHCPECGRRIRGQHLVPVLSWIWLRGRCADCHRSIHWQYPVVEGATAFLFVIVAFRHPLSDGNPSRWVLETLLVCALLVIVIMDLRWKEVPVELIIALTVASLILQLSRGWFHGTLTMTTIHLVLAFSAALLFFGGQWLISRGRWIGSGDVYFAMLMAAVLSWPGIAIAVYVAYVMGGFGALVLLATRKIRRTARVPFTPLLATGLLVAFWFGSSILTWLD